MSHLHQPNHKCKVCWTNTPNMGTWMEDWEEDPTSIRLSHWGYPCPIGVDLDGGSDIHQTDTYLSSQSSCILLRLQ